MTVAISATGLWTPSDSVTNAELVASFNAYVERYNAEHADEIAAGARQALLPSSVEFIEKASGIKHRFMLDKEGSLDVNRMVPRIPERPNEQLSLMAEVSVNAGKQALERAGRDPGDVGAVICTASSLQRPYPALAIEVQNALGASGFGYDMNVACSSATFAIQNAHDIVKSGHARSVLVVNPELTTGHLNLRDRDTHFIFGDAAVAVLVERADIAPKGAWAILGTKLKTQFSNNIRNNFGFLNRADEAHRDDPDKLITQQGRKVFKEVVPLVSEMILQHMHELGLKPADMRRLWLHQANSNMNRLIAERVLGHEASQDEAPTVLDVYGNTAGAGSIIAFHLHSDDLKTGDKGLICSFGAGYSAGSIFVQKAA
ncbi:MAG TPA: beta-ketoacyl-ACP synthase III [Vitreimonas sp.]|uniref:beta-ketoacyl-ACP synthase III n=1 Tax=Vitreimonas sp. TaxID=3069702 RepID=UPI002D324CF2|nr:beta-ketoacyl-ACP synthase III [Vitreimonas sp.]HYD87307.1 beta-ketoacyl-ACP synthase III [Vitreimonas sp.]